MTTQRVLVLVGSPRANSTSETLAKLLTGDLAARGWQVDVQHIYPALRQPVRWTELEEQVRDADVVVLAFPLYVDALPGETTRALERLAAGYQDTPPARPQRWLAIVNCGFLEAAQNDVALAICEQFTRESGVNWAGGLAIGGGGALGGRQPEEVRTMAKKLARGFAMTADALDRHQPVPAEALALVRTRFLPPWAYFLLANLGMYLGAHKYHNMFRINARPYARVR